MKQTRKRGMQVAGAVLASLMLAVSMSGCSLLTPKRADVPVHTMQPRVSSPTIGQDGTLLIGVISSDTPQVIADDPANLTGYTIDVGRALAAKMGLNAQFVSGADLSKVGTPGGPDIYLGAEKRDLSEVFSLTGSFLEDAPALFAKTKEGGRRIAVPSVHDLAGSTIAVQSASTAQDILRKANVQATQKEYANVNEALSAVAKGEADYAACDATSGGYLARMFPGVSFVCALDKPSIFGVAIRAKNSVLQKEIAAALNTLSTDGALDAIHRAWYGNLPLSLENTLASGIASASDASESTSEPAGSTTTD